MVTPETTRPLAVWATGEPVPEAQRRCGSFSDMIRATVGDVWDGPWLEIDCVSSAALPDPDGVAGVIVTGSAARVADQTPWMLRVQAQLRVCVAQSVPVLGICFGHQLLGMALGGRSGPNPRGREIGTATLTIVGDDPLFEGAPSTFPVSTTHLDSVLELPPGAVSRGYTELEQHAVIRFAEHVWGVQFHPEMGADVIGDYIEARRDALLGEGLDPDRLLAARVDTPHSAGLLRRFAQHVRRSRS